jgi:hypothetical protein
VPEYEQEDLKVAEADSMSNNLIDALVTAHCGNVDSQTKSKNCKEGSTKY